VNLKIKTGAMYPRSIMLAPDMSTKTCHFFFLLQLLSPRNGHVLATREIHVSHDKVSIKRLDVKLITGMTMYVEPSGDMDGALVATADINSQFVGKHHVRISPSSYSNTIAL